MISAIIPAWCESSTIAGAVTMARAFCDEVVVVDADSPDGTAELAQNAGARVVSSERGRGQQLSAGATAARGEVLLFLHADTRLPPEAALAIERALTDKTIGGGNFKLRFEPAAVWGRVFAGVNNQRRRWLRIYYGDSGVFVRRSVYEAIGGFRAVPILEDYDFVCRLEHAVRTVFVTDVEIIASARRFEDRPLRTLAIWTMIQTLGVVGASPRWLAKLYADIR